MADEIVYRELRPDEVIQPGDKWQTESGRWALSHQSMIGQPVRDGHCRRPYNITQITKERDRLADAVNDLLKKNHHITKELARLQQSSPPADHIADVNKMVETELERKAWELFVHTTQGIEHSFTLAHYWMTERNRRRHAGMATTDAVGD